MKIYRRIISAGSTAYIVKKDEENCVLIDYDKKEDKYNSPGGAYFTLVEIQDQNGYNLKRYDEIGITELPDSIHSLLTFMEQKPPVKVDPEKKAYTGYVTYLNVRVSQMYRSHNIAELCSKLEQEMAEIPKLSNCSFVIEPNLVVEPVPGFDSFEEYENYGEPFE